MNRFLLCQLSKCVVLLAFVMSTNLQAKEKTQLPAWIDDVKWHGFISQSFIGTDENDFLGNSSRGSLKFRSAGLNASYKPSSSLQFSVQGLYKQIGNAEPKGTQLDYAIVDWAVIDSFDYGAGIRAGRLKNPYGFFNETRDVAATRPSLLLPESIYIDYLQAIFHSMDSVGLYFRSEHDSGTFSLETNYGKPILTDDIVNTLMGGNAVSGDLKDERGTFTRFMFEDAAGLWRAGLSYIWFYADYKDGYAMPSPPLFLVDGEVEIKQLLLSAELNLGKFSFIGEAFRRNAQVRDAFQHSIGDVYDKPLGFYFQTTFKPTHDVDMYVRYDKVYYDKDDKGGKDFQASGRGFYHTALAKDVTLGISYKPSFAWSFGMEYHIVDGTYWLPNLENPDLQRQVKHWNMFLAQVAYRF